jgi:hypothetical protein
LNKGKRGWENLIKRFDGKIKDGILLTILGLFVIVLAWQVFHTDKESSTSVFATETEMKVVRLLQEIDGVGEANVIVYEKEGYIESVVVVCEGANNLWVVMNVREAVAAALGAEEKSIKIYQKKE